MEFIFNALIVGIVVFFAIRASKKKRGETDSHLNNKSNVAKPIQVQKTTSPNRQPKNKNINNKMLSASVSSLLDDRENDWLANQLREEHRAFRRTSDMFDLKIEHVSHCDSKLLANYHHINCDANAIDTGTH